MHRRRTKSAEGQPDSSLVDMIKLFGFVLPDGIASAIESAVHIHFLFLRSNPQADREASREEINTAAQLLAFYAV